MSFFEVYSRKTFFLFLLFMKHSYMLTAKRLCIKPGIQERGTECGNAGNGEYYIPGNVAKHSGECPQTFRAMSPSIPENVLKHSGECHQTFWGMSPNILGNVAKHLEECRQILRGMSSNIPGNVAKHSR